MTIAGAAILFTRAVNTHNQLKLIVNNDPESQFKRLLDIMGVICSSENTRENRDKLQKFIIENGERIYIEYSKILSKDNEFSYDLK